MKTVAAITLVLGTLFAGVASARSIELAPPAAQRVYTCEGRALSRVALATQPAACCVGLFGCPQLLSNSGLIRPRRNSRT